MARRERESEELEAMIGRTLRALVRRAGQGDTTALEALGRLEGTTAAATTVALRRASYAYRVLGEGFYSYGELAQVMGVSRQAIQQRIHRPNGAAAATVAWLAS